MGTNNGNTVTRRRFLAMSGAAAPLVLASPAMAADTGPLKAAVEVEPEPLHSLPSTQYGHFIEHLGKCIKGGIWAEGESEDMFLGGVRSDLVEAMRSINPSLIRYPGGCFADGYHWQDGIGPREDRPRRPNQAWGKFGPLVGPVDDNHFGTDEFLQLCEAVGAEPQLTANVGSGTAEEAAAWVEYCNGAKSTRWGGERARNGHPDPYRVKYWFVGNEIFGWHEIGNQPPEQYFKTFREYALAMRRVDPDIKLIAVGAGTEANKVMLEGAGEVMDYLSIHQYVPAANAFNAMRFQVARLKGSAAKSIYYDVIGTLDHMRKFVESSVRDVNTYSPPGRKVPLSFDEWNLWFYFLGDITKANYCLRDGLWTAAMLNLFHRHAPDMPLANIAQMVNCLGIINSSKRSTFLTPSALAFKLYTERSGDELVASRVDCPPIPHETGFPVLDVSATKSGDKMALFLVNLHRDAGIEVSCTLKGMRAGEVKRQTMTHSSPVKYNTHSRPAEVSIKERPAEARVTKAGSGSIVELELEPHSLTCLEIETKRA